MTASPHALMTFSYDPFQVGLSVLIAIAACYASLDLAGRVTANQKGVRTLWLIGGAISMGSGISAMHFVGMLAFHLPVPIFYHWPTVLYALLVAILASAAALSIVSRHTMGLRYALISGTVLGSGVAALHYLGMSAMRMAATYTLNPMLVTLSVALGIVFAMGGMWLGYYFRDEPRNTAWKRVGAGLLMGSAIAAMHYTGMAAASFRPAPDPFPFAHTVYVSTPATLGISAVILILLATTILSCLLDRRFDVQGFELAMAQDKFDLANTMRGTLIGQMAASIAHEIRQPLAAMVTNANYSLRELLEKNPNFKEVRVALEEIVADGNRTSSIISRIRALVMKEAPDQARAHVNEVLREVLRFVRSDAERERIEVRVELTADLHPVMGDRIHLQQAFLNVITNSIEALRSVPETQRRLVLRTLRSREGVVVQIENSGPALTSEISDRLFQPFFTTKREGMGLGLSISRSLVEAYGGRLSHISTAQGVLFAFVLSPDAENPE